MRWLVRLGVLVLLLVALGVTALMLIPGDRIARIAERRFEEATGRAMTLTGGISATIYPQLGIRIGGVSVANAAWSDDGPMLTAKAARIGVNAWALMSGSVRIEEVEITEPVLILVADEQGRTNWDFEVENGGASIGAPEASGNVPAFSLDRGLVQNGTVIYRNLATGKDTRLEALDLSLRLPEFSGPASVDLSALLHGIPHKLVARIDEFDTFLTGDITTLDLEVDSGDNSLSLNGQGGYSPTAFEGQLDARFADIPQFFTAIGDDAPEIPAGFGRDRIDISGAVTLTPEQTLHLRNGSIRLDDNRLTGAFDANLLGDRPQFNARLAGDQLDFSSLAAGEGQGEGQENTAPADSWPTDPINADAVSAIDGDLAFTANGISFGTLTLGKTEILTSIDRSRAVFGLRSISAYGGQVTGEFVMNNRNGLSVGGNLNLADMSIQPFLSDLADYERLIGTGNAKVNFLGVGNNLDAIMKSLSGSGSISLTNGELRGLDLAGMLRNLDSSYEGSGSKTIFDAITASFVIEAGVLSNSDLLFDAPLARATGQGQVDIGRKRLNYRVVPVALANEDGSGGISVPVIITGPWSDPSFRPDLEFLLEQELAEERKAAEEALKQQAEEALGVQREEGESLEDAVKRELEEELGNKLLDIFGGN